MLRIDVFLDILVWYEFDRKKMNIIVKIIIGL